MAATMGSITSQAPLNQAERAHSLFHRGKKAAKAGHALGTQQQFATLLAKRQAVLHSAASGTAAKAASGGTTAQGATSALASSTAGSTSSAAMQQQSGLTMIA